MLNESSIVAEMKKGMPINNSAPSAIYMELIKVFPLIKICNDSQHQSALSVMESLIIFLNKNENDMKNDHLDQINQYLSILGGAVEEYEKIHYPMDKPSGREMLEYFMECQELTQMDLREELGGQPVVSAILSGKRELNVRQIRALANRFGVDAKVFLGEMI